MKRHVALIIETSSSYGRDLLSGIIRFMRMHDDWSVFLEQRDLWQQPPAWLEHWKGDGIISRATTPKLIEAIQKTGVPLVEVTDRHAETELPQIRSDDVAIGRVAADHLLERGFRRFAFCGFTNEAWSERREEGFVEQVASRCDSDVARYCSPWHGRGAKPWEDEQDALTEWLKSLAPPIGIMACNDVRGQQLIDVCSKLQLAVPEQVAIVGVDNDDLLCRMCSPPLSSVMPNAEMVGFRAAELLTDLMNGKSAQRDVQLIAPLGVKSRQSTDVVAIDDRQIAAALHFIRENACRGLTVQDVVSQCKVSRSTLERLVRRYLGRTPQEEIRHVQIKRVQELLLTTDLPAEKIASLCGFEHPEYMHVVFKRIMGMTIGTFRRKARV